MKSKRKIDKAYVLPLFLVVLIMITALSNAVFAKYLRRFNYDGKVTVSAELVGKLELFESEASRTPLGDYSLTEVSVTENSYVLMPGVDIKKDPTIRVTGKTSIPAYLYLVVDDNTAVLFGDDDTITYSLTNNWILIGKNGTKSLYVYGTDGTPVKMTDATAPEKISILEKNEIYVSEHLDKTYTGEIGLDFYAYMAQYTGDTVTLADALATFNNNFDPDYVNP